MVAVVRGIGWLVVGLVIGYVVGAFGAAFYNHLECSSVAQTLNGCTSVRPNAVGRLLAVPGAFVLVFAMRRPRRQSPPSARGDD